MASGAKRVFRGSFSGTGALKDITTIGFRPTWVKLWLQNGNDGVWTETMADASAFKRVAAGTGSFVTTNGVTPLSTGFRLGTDASLNVNGVVTHFEAGD
jgi:hypothetical protein